MRVKLRVKVRVRVGARVRVRVSLPARGEGGEPALLRDPHKATYYLLLTINYYLLSNEPALLRDPHEA